MTPVKKDEQIGFHKGAIATLLKERTEVIKMLNIVNALLNAHVNELRKLGVDITKPVPEAGSKKAVKRK